MGQPSLRERKKARTQAAIGGAALKLFSARGFNAVTLADVAAAADVGERTVFRYFPDKQELLFGEDAVVRDRLANALASRPLDESPATAVREALVSLAFLWQDRQDEGRVRQAVIDASPALKARERAKHIDHERVLGAGLVARGMREPQARLLARAAVACLDESIKRWLADHDAATPGLETRSREAFAELGSLLDTAQ